MLERPFFRGWRTDNDGRPFRFRQKCREYQDPSFHREWREWPLRSTLTRDEIQNKWLVVELCQNYRLLPNVEGPIEECDKGGEVLTVLHRQQEGVQVFGEIIGEFHQLTEGDLVKNSDGAEVGFAYRKEPEVPMEILFPVEEEETTQPGLKWRTEKSWW